MNTKDEIALAEMLLAYAFAMDEEVYERLMKNG